MRKLQPEKVVISTIYEGMAFEFDAGVLLGQLSMFDTWIDHNNIIRNSATSFCGVYTR